MQCERVSFKKRNPEKGEAPRKMYYHKRKMMKGNREQERQTDKDTHKC